MKTYEEIDQEDDLFEEACRYCLSSKVVLLHQACREDFELVLTEWHA
ncbi:hypothetical protein KHA80_15965 [Anaerobacillus sp. HL2]|nr:hypothetical protein KHA80_15965 [Anaerobacillus sp. HL2]